MDHTALSRQLRSLTRTCRKFIGEQRPLPARGGDADSVLLAMMEMALSHAQAVQALAEKHFDHGWSALCVARSCFEAGAASAWIGTPSDPFDREGRWIGYFRKLERFYKTKGEMLEGESPGISDQLKSILSSKHGVFKQVLEKHPDIKVVQYPKMRDLLKALKYEHLYIGYIEACEITHSGPEAVYRSRDQLLHQSKKRVYTYKCRVTPEFWQNAILMSGWGAAVSSYHALLRNGADINSVNQIFVAHNLFNEAITKMA